MESVEIKPAVVKKEPKKVEEFVIEISEEKKAVQASSQYDEFLAEKGWKRGVFVNSKDFYEVAVQAEKLGLTRVSKGRGFIAIDCSSIKGKIDLKGFIGKSKVIERK